MRPTDSQKRKTRWYWIQIHRKDDEFEHIRKFTWWKFAITMGNTLLSTRSDIQAIYLIDGNLPKSELRFPPKDKVWHRWEPLGQDGSGRRGLKPVNAADELRHVARGGELF